MKRRARDLDGVRLLKEVNGWPAGTPGAVVSEAPETALVELSSEDRRDEEGSPVRNLMDDFVWVPYEDLEVVYSPAPLSAADLQVEGSGRDGQSARSKK
jgi:hypothetical protein